MSAGLLYELADVFKGHLPKDRKHNSKAPDATLKTPPTLRFNANDLSIHGRQSLVVG